MSLIQWSDMKWETDFYSMQESFEQDLHPDQIQPLIVDSDQKTWIQPTTHPLICDLDSFQTIDDDSCEFDLYIHDDSPQYLTLILPDTEYAHVYRVNHDQPTFCGMIGPGESFVNQLNKDMKIRSGTVTESSGESIQDIIDSICKQHSQC